MDRLPDLSSLSHDEKDALIHALWAQVQALTAQVATLTADHAPWRGVAASISG